MHIFTLSHCMHSQKSAKTEENQTNPIFSPRPHARDFFFFVPSVFTPGFPNDLFFSFITYAVLPASCSFICLIALHTFQDTEVARVTIHVSKVTKDLNNTPKLVLNIPKHISIWQKITVLDSLFVRMYEVKIVQNRL